MSFSVVIPTYKRPETLIPVLDPEIREHLRDTVLHAYLLDSDRAMTLDSEGRYVPAEQNASGRFNAQHQLLRHYTDPGELGSNQRSMIE